MKETRIYSLLNNSNKTKLNRFGKYLASPYFNKNNALLILGDKLISAIKKGAEPETNLVMWSICKGSNIPYNDLKFRKLCNELLDRFENFLIIEELENDKLLKSNLLLSSIKNNKFETLAEKHISKSSKLIDRQADQSAEFYLQKHFYEKTIFNLKTDYEKKENISSTLNKLRFQDYSVNLHAFYVTENLRHATHMLFWRRMFKTDIIIDVGYTLDIIEKYKLGEFPAVKIYHLMYLIMSDEGNDETFLLLKKMAAEQIEIFPKSERREVLDALLTYCIKETNRGESGFYEHLLSIYDWGIDSEIMLENGFVSPTTFRNYVLAGLRYGSFEEVEHFIHERSSLLEKKYRENAMNFNLARVNFYKKDYDSVISFLNKVSYADVFYAVESRMLLQAAYFEKNEFDALESTIDAFTKFLRRDKTLETFKASGYINFSKYLKRFIQFKEKDYTAFIDKIKQTTPLYNKQWLIQKIEEHQA